MQPHSNKALTPMEPASTSSAATIALAKYFGMQLILGVISTALTFIVLPPKTRVEFFGRMACTLLASYLFGPVLVAAAHGWFPELFDSAAAVAVLHGQDASFGVLYVSAPLQVIAGMPAWWVIGAFVWWFDRRRGSDIGDLVSEARSVFVGGRGEPSRAGSISPRASGNSDE